MKGFWKTRTVNVVNDCSIAVDGRRGGSLRDLRIGDEMVFSYEDVDGIPVAGYIGRELPAAPKNSPTAYDSGTREAGRDAERLNAR